LDAGARVALLRDQSLRYASAHELARLAGSVDRLRLRRSRVPDRAAIDAGDEDARSGPRQRHRDERRQDALHLRCRHVHRPGRPGVDRNADQRRRGSGLDLQRLVGRLRRGRADLRLDDDEAGECHRAVQTGGELRLRDQRGAADALRRDRRRIPGRGRRSLRRARGRGGPARPLRRMAVDLDGGRRHQAGGRKRLGPHRWTALREDARRPARRKDLLSSRLRRKRRRCRPGDALLHGDRDRRRRDGSRRRDLRRLDLHGWIHFGPRRGERRQQGMDGRSLRAVLRRSFPRLLLRDRL